MKIKHLKNFQHKNFPIYSMYHSSGTRFTSQSKVTSNCNKIHLCGWCISAQSNYIMYLRLHYLSA